MTDLDWAAQIIQRTGQAAIDAHPDSPETEPILLLMLQALVREGFRVARQQNPSGAISKDKLCVWLNGTAWHAYDVLSDAPLRLSGMQEVFPAHPVQIQVPEAPSPAPSPIPPIDVLGEILKSQQVTQALIEQQIAALRGLAAVVETLTQKKAPIYRASVLGRTVTLVPDA